MGSRMMLISHQDTVSPTLSFAARLHLMYLVQGVGLRGLGFRVADLFLCSATAFDVPVEICAREDVAHDGAEKPAPI